MNRKRQYIVIVFSIVTVLIILNILLYQREKKEKVDISEITCRYLKNCNINTYEINNLAEYENKKIKVQNVQVTSEEIQDYINTVIESYSYMKPVEDRNIVQNGDFVYVSYHIYENDVAIKEVSGDVLKVGSGYYDPQFEKLLPDAIVGQEFIKTITIEDDEGQYHNWKYCITVDSIQEYIRYTLDDVFVQEKLGLESVEVFNKAVEKKLTEEKQVFELEEAGNALLRNLVKNSEIRLNEQEIAKYAKLIVKKYEEVAYVSNMELEQYYTEKLKLTKTQFYEKCYEEARMTICRELVIGAIAQKEKVNVTNKEISEYKKENPSEQDDVLISQYLLKRKVINLFKKG